MNEFDAPLFKILAPNDTGNAPGHQGGIVIPRDLDPYFPQLSRQVTPAKPTVDQFVVAHLFDGPQYLDTVETRYQFQTWGGTRSPERRLTGNLGPIRNLAVGGDILLIERGVVDETVYRLTLVRNGTNQFHNFAAAIQPRRWGPLYIGAAPARESEVEQALTEILEHEHKAFALFDEAAGVVEGRTRTVARSRAFQTRLVELYDRRCAICETGLVHPSGRCEPHAAHIVPRRLKGADDARNGLLLCRTHHWAFDEGLIGINPDYDVIVPALVLQADANASLAVLAGRKIRLPTNQLLAPDANALTWHMQNLLIN